MKLLCKHEVRSILALHGQGGDALAAGTLLWSGRRSDAAPPPRMTADEIIAMAPER